MTSTTMSNKSQQKSYSNQGNLLKAARTKRGLTQTEVAFSLRLNKTQISAIERGVPNAWNGAYERGYIQSYAKLMDLQISFEETGNKPKKEGLKPGKLSERSYVASQISVAVLLVLAAGILLSYVLWQVYALTSAPSMVIHQPEQTEVLTEQTAIRIKGNVEENVDVTINGVSVLTDSNGRFSVVVPLNPGVNDFAITATNKLSKQTTIQKTVVADYQIDTSVKEE